jgi:hypothetical protein
MGVLPKVFLPPGLAKEYPNLILSGVPTSCYGGAFNGVWQFSGLTADERPFYKWMFKMDPADIYKVDEADWRVLHYDKDCDGDAGDDGKPTWIFGIDLPSTIAEHDLDLDGTCTSYGNTYVTTTSMTPPSGDWRVACAPGGLSTALTLTIVPACQRGQFVANATACAPCPANTFQVAEDSPVTECTP